MSAEIVGFTNGLLTLKVSATLTEVELRAAQQAAGELIREYGKLRILVLAEDFAGWERGGQWNDFSFQARYDQSIDRMAIVGDSKWEELALMFAAKDMRHFPIEYFESADLEAARAWLTAN
jgi:hypothetical protein